MSPIRRAAPLLSLAVLAGCDLAPDYHPEKMVLPASWKGEGPWHVAAPADAAPRGAWWTMFGNATLDALEPRVGQNPDLQAEAEAYEQARDLAAEAEAGLYPHVGSSFTPSDNHESVQSLFRNPTSTNPLTSTNVEGEATASWQIDLWGRIRNMARARKEEAQASAADLANMRLSLQAELADSYLTLRGLDTEIALYGQTIASYQTGVTITTLRLTHQIGSLIDVERSKTELSAAEALLSEAQSQRAVAENAIAVLIGVPASSFTLPPQNATPFADIEVPAGLPSALLERRPDVARAEREMAAANAEIGVARAAFYPSITLNGDYGRDANNFQLFKGPFDAWSVGATLMEPLFEGGLRTAELRYAKSAYAQNRDAYRSTVLNAIQQTENEISLSRHLETEEGQASEAQKAADKTQSLTTELYQQGLDDYLDVVVAEVSALQAGITTVQVGIRAAQARVDLIRALGGGWSASQLPPLKTIVPFDPLLP